MKWEDIRPAHFAWATVLGTVAFHGVSFAAAAALLALVAEGLYHRHLDSADVEAEVISFIDERIKAAVTLEQQRAQAELLELRNKIGSLSLAVGLKPK